MRLPLTVANAPAPSGRWPGVLNVAHRGASNDVAENTLAAVRRAIACDADLVELDVQRTKDGALVLLHDTTLLRTTDVQRVFPDRAPWTVADFTHDELLRLDAGSWKSPLFAGERVPTLAEAVEVLRPSSAGLLLELKAPELYPGIVSDVVSELRSIPGYLESVVATGRLVVQSFSYSAMKDHKTRAPEVPVGLLGTPARGNLAALGTWADQVNPSHYSVDRAYVDQVHRQGMACLVWTVNRGPALRRALRMGVDGVITNRPDALGRLLGRLLDRPSAGQPQGRRTR